MSYVSIIQTPPPLVTKNKQIAKTLPTLGVYVIFERPLLRAQFAVCKYLILMPELLNGNSNFIVKFLSPSIRKEKFLITFK